MFVQGAVFHTIIICVCILLQSTLLNRIGGLPVTPDLALVVLVFSAYKQGKMRGQLSGLASGLLFDLLSLAPLGMHSLIRTTIAYLFGLMKGKIFVDPVFVPVIMVIIATIMKYLFGSILAALFIPSMDSMLFSDQFLWELGINIVIAPFILAILQFLHILSINEKDSNR